MTELFPQEEPLKFKIRERANDILAGLILCAGNPVKITAGDKKRITEDVFQNMEIIKGYFKVGEGQKWIDSRNFSLLKKEYNKIRREIGDKEEEIKQNSQNLAESNTVKTIMPVKVDNNEELSDRQKRVFQLLKQRHKIKVGELVKAFSNISKRTLQRDLEILASKGFVVRNGSHNGIFYEFKDKQKS